jgi:hypothetical protein
MQLVRSDYNGKCTTLSTYHALIDSRRISLGQRPCAQGFETEELLSTAQVILRLETLLDKHQVVINDQSDLFDRPLHTMKYKEAKMAIHQEWEHLCTQLQERAGIINLRAYLKHPHSTTHSQLIN